MSHTVTRDDSTSPKDHDETESVTLTDESVCTQFIKFISFLL